MAVLDQEGPKLQANWRHEWAEDLKQYKSEWKRGKQTHQGRDRRKDNNIKEPEGRSLTPAAEAGCESRVHFLSPPILFWDSSSHLLTTSPSCHAPSPLSLLAWVSLCSSLEENGCFTFIKWYFFSLALTQVVSSQREVVFFCFFFNCGNTHKM